jgi:hypothetical protein
MALAGTDSALGKKLFNSVKSKLEAKIGKQAKNPEFIEAMCEAIAEIIVPHIVSNLTVLVDPGIPVATAGSPAAQTGATTGPGTGKAQ